SGGQRFVESEADERRRPWLWRERLFTLHLFRLISDALVERPDRSIDRDLVLEDHRDADAAGGLRGRLQPPGPRGPVRRTFPIPSGEPAAHAGAGHIGAGESGHGTSVARLSAN